MVYLLYKDSGMWDLEEDEFIGWTNSLKIVNKHLVSLRGNKLCANTYIEDYENEEEVKEYLDEDNELKDLPISIKYKHAIYTNRTASDFSYSVDRYYGDPRLKDHDECKKVTESDGLYQFNVYTDCPHKEGILDYKINGKTVKEIIEKEIKK